MPWSQPIGDDRTASDVLAALYRQPYRILHISAHGVFDLRARRRPRRSGVVLSDGLLITAAEIDAMEIVPELVFLNCCHLGKVDYRAHGAQQSSSPRAWHASSSRSACAASSWPAGRWTTMQASSFGETFYQQ